MFKKFLTFLGLFAFPKLLLSDDNFRELSTHSATTLYTIEGIILAPGPGLRVGSQWPADIKLSIDNGEYQGFVRRDGNFMISGIPAGSYVLYAHHADIFFQPIRVEIARNGNIRARQLSHIKPSHVIKLPYPLLLKPLERRKYFRTREQWNLLDYVLNPMVLLMVVPLLMMLLLSRLITDPETKREIESIQFPQIPNNMPDLGDLLASFVTGKRLPEKKKPTAGTAYKRRN
ncbi:GH11292 [Drosophila grimshawi]|uniref:GH11292 n=1 Tax=Drosophila grimshawi TaxID=7222 RepID=B4JE23_DROGR|nr:GH11292 [Drosophila grimshawi]